MAKARKLPVTEGTPTGLSEEHRRMIAYGIATMHRFSPEPTLKYGKPTYKNTSTVESIAHAKSKRGS